MLTSELIDESLYATISAMPIGFLQSRILADGTTIRRFHGGKPSYRDANITLIPDAGFATVFFRNSHHMVRCFTCDCLWSGNAKKCWQCGEKRALPEPLSLEHYAGE